MARKVYTIEQINKSREEHSKWIERFKKNLEGEKKFDILCPTILFSNGKISPDKKYPLNLNSYRNRAFHLNSDLKIKFKELIEDQLSNIKIEGKFKLKYIIYWSNLCDGANIYSVVDKFLCDSLQEMKCINNDNINILTGCSWENGGKDKENPRVEVYIIKE